jgi:hypothetical protein
MTESTPQELTTKVNSSPDQQPSVQQPSVQQPLPERLEWTFRMRNYQLVLIAFGLLSLGVYSLTKLF